MAFQKKPIIVTVADIVTNDQGENIMAPVGITFQLGRQFVEVRMRGEQLEIHASGPWNPSLILQPLDHSRLHVSLTPEEI